MFSQHLFGTDGIRGIAGEYPLDKETMELIGRCTISVFLKHYTSKKIVIGRDTRKSGVKIVETLRNIFIQSGYEVLDAGIFPTTGIAYLCREYHCPGVVVTASHNPYQFNGIKFFSDTGEKIKHIMEAEIEKLVFKKTELLVSPDMAGKIRDISFEAEAQYIHFLENIWNNPPSSLSLILDCANGSTYHVVPLLFQKLFPKSQYIHTEPNGVNINDHCGALYPDEVKKHLPNNGIGIAFDGDGDRVMFVDEEGNVRDGDYILAILATEYRREGILKNNVVIPTVMSNLGFLRHLEKKKIKTVLSPVGDRHVYALMLEHDAILGGEQSGHIILRQYLPAGDGMLVALEILRIMEKRKKRLVDLCQMFEKYPQVLKNIEVSQKPSLDVIFPKEMIEQYEKQIDGRILIRYSGTEPLLRIMVEGKERAGIDKVAGELETIVRKSI